MEHIVNSYFEENRYVCLHTNADNTGSFIYGRVIGVDSDFFAVSMVSPDGTYDGIVVKLIDDIIYAEHNITYDEIMSKLMKDRGYTDNTLPLYSNDILSCTLELAVERKTIVSIELNHSGVDDIVGFIENVRTDVCVINTVDELGKENGRAAVSMRNITQLCFESTDENRILALWRGRGNG